MSRIQPNYGQNSILKPNSQNILSTKIYIRHILFILFSEVSPCHWWHHNVDKYQDQSRRKLQYNKTCVGGQWPAEADSPNNKNPEEERGIHLIIEAQANEGKGNSSYSV